MFNNQQSMKLTYARL
jgi:U3 small nucleolar RNA-associated protein 15